MNKHNHSGICPVERAGVLDSSLRRLLQNPKKILRPFIRPGMTAIDLGCGPGFFTFEMARMLKGSGEVYAADLQKGMLDIVSQKIKGSPLEKTVKLYKCNEDRIGLPIRADFILAFYMIHEVPDPIKLFKELKTLLKPEGRLLIIEPKFHVDRNSFEAMNEKLQETGFKITERPRVFFSRAVVLMVRST